MAANPFAAIFRSRCVGTWLAMSARGLAVRGGHGKPCPYTGRQKQAAQSFDDWKFIKKNHPEVARFFALSLFFADAWRKR